MSCLFDFSVVMMCADLHFVSLEMGYYSFVCLFICFPFIDLNGHLDIWYLMFVYMCMHCYVDLFLYICWK